MRLRTRLLIAAGVLVVLALAALGPVFDLLVPKENS
jgi:hypothetical protein